MSSQPRKHSTSDPTMSHLTLRALFRFCGKAFRMAMPLLAIAMLATVTLSSCESEQEKRQPDFFSDYGAPPPRKESIWDNWFVKYLTKMAFIVLVVGGGRALFSGNKSGSTTNTTQPTQPTPSPQPPRTPTPVVTAPPQTPSGAIWFYRQDGQEFGPFTQDALTQLVACNVIARTTEIRRQGGAWVAYTDVFGV